MTDYDRQFFPAQPTAQAPRPHGCILIAHGMAEHQARYRSLAQYLNQCGWHVVTYDHPGHGPQAQASGTLGQLGPKGWTAVTDRLQEMVRFAQSHAGGLPLWLMGHSMGSFSVLDYAERFPLPANFKGLVLIGTDSPRWRDVAPLKWISEWHIKRYGPTSVSPRLNRFIFNELNKKLKNTQTEVDWICSNPDTIAAYRADSLCGFYCSAQFWFEFSQLLQRLRNNKHLSKLPSQSQVILMAGGQDPVGRFGTGPTQLALRLRRYGPGAELKLYPTSRHEILNEKDYRPVWADLQRMVSDFSKP